MKITSFCGKIMVAFYTTNRLTVDGSTRLYITFCEYDHSNVQRIVGRIEIPIGGGS